VVRPNWFVLGDALAEHAISRHRNRISWNVFTRRDEHLRRSRHDTPIRNLWRAVHRRGSVVPRPQQFKAFGRLLPRDLFPADFSQVRRRALRRGPTAHSRPRKVSAIFDGNRNYQMHSQKLPCPISMEATSL